MCGEHLPRIFTPPLRPGSSPHVRGARAQCGEDAAVGGIIPACAGSTCRPTMVDARLGDHPRMCGEHRSVRGQRHQNRGSSPHVRGAPNVAGDGGTNRGIIPACAGSTPAVVSCPFRSRDHPRMCGEHSSVSGPSGNPLGSSPHVRGAPDATCERIAGDGIIPACAGSTYEACRSGSGDGDHPRMCGEHRGIRISAPCSSGSSPHVRGALRSVTVCQIFAGIIPACAGSTPTFGAKANPAGDHPRMCGEHVLSPEAIAAMPGSSPHVRGALMVFAFVPHIHGIIPACAGSTG